MSLRRCILPFAAFCAGAGVLAGCGGVAANGSASSPSSPAATKGTVADLRGGWLIAGVMPLSDLTSSGLSSVGLVLNLDIVNGQVTGFGALQLPCGSGGTLSGDVGGTIRLGSATVAADGTFTLTDVLAGSNTQHQVVVQGTVPATPGGVWSGTYTVSAPLANCNGVVPPAQMGAFTAQKIADLDGTFAGSGTLNRSSSPVTFTMSLTQGGAASLNGLIPSVNDQNVLNGTLQVQGISCFKGGSIQAPGGVPQASLLGNHAATEFLMDDGSTVLLNGTESNTAASTLVTVSLLVVGGACDKTFASLTTAVKQ